MKHSMFRRHFLLTAGMILTSFFLLAAAFMTLSYRYMVQERTQTMDENVSYVAMLTQKLMDRGFAPTSEQEGFPFYSPALSSISQADLLLCDSDGMVIRYADNGGTCKAYGEPDAIITPSITSTMEQQGSYSGMSDMSIYSSVHFVSGRPIYVQTETGPEMEFMIFMTASAEDLMVLWRSLATLFFFTAVVVFCIAFVSNSIFSLQQAKPLQELTDVVRRFGLGEHDLRITDYHRNDEIGELASTFNTMADSLASTEKDRREFVANISHELKTPLTTISGFTSGILDGTIPPERVNESLQVVASETARLSRLVRRMLDMSALQNKETVNSQVEFDICETMVQAVISLEGKIRSHRLDMDLHIPDKRTMVWGDPDGITQVCYNLLDNAAKFACPGSVISVSITAKNRKAYISIKNQGETIPPDEIGMIFDRFHKSDRSRSMDKEGVGLGLHIVKTILNQHKENITVTSENGVTEFIFTLALAS